MKFFRHSGGRINLDHVAEVVPVTGMAATGLRVLFAADPNGISHTDVFGPDADRLRLILDAEPLVMQEPPKPAAKAEPDIEGEVWVSVNRATREPAPNVYRSRRHAETAPYEPSEWEAVQLA